MYFCKRNTRNTMIKGNKKLLYGEVMEEQLRFNVTERQYKYVKARSKVDREPMGEVVRKIIDKAYNSELLNGVDVVKVAKDHGLL